MSTNINDQQRTTEPSVAEMADIMDFNNIHSKTAQQHEDEDAVFEVEAIEGEETEDPINHKFNPEKNATKVGFRKNGTAKAVLVGSLGLVGVVGAISLFQGQMPKEQVARAPKTKDVAEEQVEQAQSAAAKAQQSESEAKAQLALSKQQESLEQANSADKNKPAETSNPDSNSTNNSNSNPKTNKIVTNPAPPVPVVPVNTNRNNTSQGLANASTEQKPAVRPASNPPVASKDIPGSAITTRKVPPATTTAVVTTPKVSIAAAPGAAKTPTRAEQTPAVPVKNSDKVKPVQANPGRITDEGKPIQKISNRTIAKVNPIGQTSTETEQPRSFPVRDSAKLPRIPIAPPPGLSEDSTPPPPPYPVDTQIGSLIVNPAPPIAIDSRPSFIEFLRTSVAANNSPQTIALNKSNDTKDPKQALRMIPAPGIITNTTAPHSLTPLFPALGSKEKNLIASKISPNSGSVVAPSLTNVENPAPSGVQPTESKTAVNPDQPAAPTTNVNGTRPAFNYSKIRLAALPESKVSLGVNEAASSSPANQVNKNQLVTETNPVLNPVSNQNAPAINPVTPSGSLGPIASSLLTGSSAKGTTLTPILWGSGATGAKFMAKLEEPLMANNKREALPAGTQLIVTARPNSGGNNNSNNSSSNSLVEVDVVGVIIQGQEYSTPAGALVIHDENNGLLVGEDYFKREDQIASRDYLTVLGGALNTLGQVLNRPSGSFSSTTSGIGSSSTNVVNNNERNVFGALLEGGFKDIPNIWNQRNQQALSQLANQPKVYQIPKGRTIRVFVNQSINF
jgi:Bacterial conjugation TrbI-like protein